jgi:predicted O-methyltransferase YrrM
MNYNLSHLTQNTTKVYGPIQDDEALLLYALIRTMGLKYIVEVGGLDGYSAKNFLRAINNEGKVITIDPNFTNRLKITNPKHLSIKKFVENVRHGLSILSKPYKLLI